MQVKLEEKKGLARELKVTVPAKEVDTAFQTQFVIAQQNAKLDGFRQGKAPMDVIKKRFGEKVTAEVGDQLMRAAVGKAFAEAKVEPAGQPRVGSADAPAEGKDFSFTIEFDVMPAITPKNYDKLKLTRETAEAGDAQVEESLAHLFKSSMSFKKKDGAAASGDQVLVDAIGYLDGEQDPFEGGRLADFKIVLGSGQLIDGFESGLEGTKAGDEKTLNLQFPKDYPADHVAGKKCRFEVTVKEVSAPAQSKPDDEFAKQFGMKDLAELKGKIKERLNEDLKSASEQRLKREMFDALDKDNQFEVPQGMVNTEFQSIWQQQLQDLQARGLPVEALGQNVEEMQKEFRDLATRRVRLGLLLTEIGKKYEVKVGDAEVSAEVNRIASQYGPQGEQVKAYYQKPENRQTLIGPIYEQKVVAKLMDDATVSDKTVKPEELLKEFGQNS